MKKLKKKKIELENNVKKSLRKKLLKGKEREERL